MWSRPEEGMRAIAAAAPGHAEVVTMLFVDPVA
jgi:hypothetical protein